jgi:Uncharacterized alpha/beta hydrolase domain (DUF2235)
MVAGLVSLRCSQILPTNLQLQAHLAGQLLGRGASNCVPPNHKYRTLILCFDGTGEDFNADNSNIVQLVSLLKKDDKSKQVVYYQVRVNDPHLSLALIE